jgi:hypothetical protein
MEQHHSRRDILKKAGLLTTVGVATLANGTTNVLAQDSGADSPHPILGVWLVKVIAPGATYNYFYSFARGGYTATGDIDEQNFAGFKFGPTMGEYVSIGERSVRYREKGWAYDFTTGNPAGSFDSKGTFTLDRKGEKLSGPGVYNLYDPSGNLIFGPQDYVVAGQKVLV